MLHRALLKTHHMTSRKKIQAIAKAAKSLSCAVVIKTGHPPGVMIAECECEDENPELDVMGKEENGKKRVAGEGGRRLSEWVSAVKRLRYKDFQLLALEPIPRPHPNKPQGRLSIPAGRVQELTEMKLLRAYLTECGISAWWTARMGFPCSSGG